MTINQRQFARTSVRLSAEIQRTNATFTAATRNLSVGGAALECERPMSDGEVVRLSLFVVVDDVEDARTPPLIVNARVMWTGEGDDGSHTAGVKFEGLSPPQQQWLERFLKATEAA